MTKQDDIVIPRSELPAVKVEIFSNGTVFTPEGKAPEDYWAKALENLALAEAVRDHIEAKEAEIDKKKLRSEAVAICNKVVGLPFKFQSPAMNVEYWESVARAARELHGK